MATSAFSTILLAMDVGQDFERCRVASLPVDGKVAVGVAVRRHSTCDRTNQTVSALCQVESCLSIYRIMHILYCTSVLFWKTDNS